MKSIIHLQVAVLLKIGPGQCPARRLALLPLPFYISIRNDFERLENSPAASSILRLMSPTPCSSVLKLSACLSSSFCTLAANADALFAFLTECAICVSTATKSGFYGCRMAVKEGNAIILTLSSCAFSAFFTRPSPLFTPS